MARLPIPGSDDGTWGDVLNDFLNVEHNPDGSLKVRTELGTKVPATRVISASTGLSGGGDLSADRTLAVVDDTTIQKVAVSKGGVQAGSRRQLNFVQGADIAITLNDDSAGNKMDITIAGTQPISAAPTPEDQNLLTWAFDPISAVSFTATASGSLALIKVWLRQTATITNIIYAISTAGTGMTSGQNFVGLYSSAGVRVGLSADQTANMGGTGIITAALTTPYAAAAGFYWVAILTNSSAASPGLARSGSLAASNLASVGLTASTRRYGSFGTGQTSLPASFTPSSIAAITNGTFWAALS